MYLRWQETVEQKINCLLGFDFGTYFGSPPRRFQHLRSWNRRIQHWFWSYFNKKMTLKYEIISSHFKQGPQFVFKAIWRSPGFSERDRTKNLMEVSLFRIKEKYAPLFHQKISCMSLYTKLQIYMKSYWQNPPFSPPMNLP